MEPSPNYPEARRRGVFKPGNPGGPGNPHAARVAQFRSSLMEASTPARQRKLAELLWALALGEHVEPATSPDGRILHEVNDDGQRVQMTRLVRPQRWAIELLLDRTIGKPKVQIELETDHRGEARSTEHRDDLVSVLIAAGLADRIPPGLLPKAQAPAPVSTETIDQEADQP